MNIEDLEYIFKDQIDSMEGLGLLLEYTANTIPANQIFLKRLMR